jgi:hypothetical protein
MADLRDVKIGDTVWIVPQRRRHSNQDPGFPAKVSNVARKYAFAYRVDGKWANPYWFHRNNGASKEQPDSNARVNGMGFDVYHSEDEFKKETVEMQEKNALLNRLDNCYGREVRKLPPEAVREITAILDRYAEREE